MKFQTVLLAFLLALILMYGSSCTDDEAVQADTTFYTGMDLSYQPMLENKGVTYYDATGRSIDLLPFLKANGVDLIRLRLWHTPEGNHSSLAEVSKYCQRIQAAGMDILLDIHYSDTWADPAHQQMPKAWEGLEINDLADSVYNYTKNVLKVLADQNTLPKIVQVGNETNSGFLWNQGRVWGNYQSNWKNYATLINRAIEAIQQQEEESQTEIATMLHYAGVVTSQAYFQEVEKQNINFDIIGLSHYSYFHSQDLDELEKQFTQLVTSFDKPIMLVEMNYAWTLDWNDWTHNWVGTAAHLVNGFPASPAGQKAFLEEMSAILKRLPNHRGIGFCWWAPDLVAFDGAQSTDGSFMENLTTFDFNHRALPVLDVFREN